MPRTTNGKGGSWSFNKEKISMCSGLSIAAIEIVLSIVDPAAFRYELLVFAGGLCGFSIAQWGDKR